MSEVQLNKIPTFKSQMVWKIKIVTAIVTL